MQIILPSIVVGAGRNGAKVAVSIAKRFTFDALLITSNKYDLNPKGNNRSYERLDTIARIEHLWLDSKSILNPSSSYIRRLLFKELPYVKNRIGSSDNNYNTVIIVGDLAEKDGIAIVPMLAEVLASMGKRILSFVTMPFSFERSVLFKSSIALRLLKEKSNCTVIIDKDAFLEYSPELSIDNCYAIAEDVMLEAVSAMLRREDSDDGCLYIATKAYTTDSSNNDYSSAADHAMKGLLTQLYSSGAENIRRALIHIVGSDLSIGAINYISKYVNTILGYNVSVDVNMLASTDDSNAKNGVLTLYEVKSTRFDAYDPLHIISKDMMLDFSCEYGAGVLAEFEERLDLDIVDIEC